MLFLATLKTILHSHGNIVSGLFNTKPIHKLIVVIKKKEPTFTIGERLLCICTI